MRNRFQKRSYTRSRRAWKPRGDHFPSAYELSWAKEHGMEPDEYASTLKAATDYEATIARELAEKYAK